MRFYQILIYIVRSKFSIKSIVCIYIYVFRMCRIKFKDISRAMKTDLILCTISYWPNRLLVKCNELISAFVYFIVMDIPNPFVKTDLFGKKNQPCQIWCVSTHLCVTSHVYTYISTAFGLTTKDISRELQIALSRHIILNRLKLLIHQKQTHS